MVCRLVFCFSSRCAGVALKLQYNAAEEVVDAPTSTPGRNILLQRQTSNASPRSCFADADEESGKDPWPRNFFACTDERRVDQHAWPRSVLQRQMSSEPTSMLCCVFKLADTDEQRADKHAWLCNCFA